MSDRVFVALTFASALGCGLNAALAGVNPSSADANRLWADYVNAWTAWNHVRTTAALAAAALLTIGLYTSNPLGPASRIKAAVSS